MCSVPFICIANIQIAFQRSSEFSQDAAALIPRRHVLDKPKEIMSCATMKMTTVRIFHCFNFDREIFQLYSFWCFD